MWINNACFTEHLHITVTTSATAQGQLTTYPQLLLEIAKSLIDQNYFSIAVIVSHMACEVATERILSQSFASKSIQNLEEPVTELLNGYNLANDKIRKLYTALTGDTIEKQPFWPNFKESAKRRNQIMHRGAIVGKTEAEESFTASSALVTHLKL